MALKLIDVREMHCQEEREIRLRRDYFALVYVSVGKIFGSINGEFSVFHAPSIICLSTRDQISELKLHKNTRISIVYFDTVFLTKEMSMDKIYANGFADVVEQHYFLQLAPFIDGKLKNKCFILDRVLSRHFTRIIGKIKLQLLHQNDFYWPYRTRSCLLEILAIIEKILYDNSLYSVKPLENKEEKLELESILQFINSNLDKNITLEELYKKFYVNGQTVEKLFNKYLKITFKQYVKNQRFALAKQNLRFTDLPLETVAIKSGYSSIQSFSKFFKKMSGTSPIAFRKDQLNLRRAEGPGKIKLK